MTQDEIKQLLSIIPNTPAMNLFHISDGKGEICSSLKELCKQRDYDYDLVTIGEENLQSLSQFGAKKISYEQARYNHRSKLYDFVFVMIDLESVPDLEMLFKKLYMIIMNGGKLLILVDKNRQSINSLDILLQECNYVAINEIDISKTHYILSATRLHGWDSH